MNLVNGIAGTEHYWQAVTEHQPRRATLKARGKTCTATLTKVRRRSQASAGFFSGRCFLEKAGAQIQAVCPYCEKSNGQSDAAKGKDRSERFGVNISASQSGESLSNGNHLGLQEE
jgi:hypothetical protein